MSKMAAPLDWELNVVDNGSTARLQRLPRIASIHEGRGAFAVPTSEVSGWHRMCGLLSTPFTGVGENGDAGTSRIGAACRIDLSSPPVFFPLVGTSMDSPEVASHIQVANRTTCGLALQAQIEDTNDNCAHLCCDRSGRCLPAQHLLTLGYRMLGTCRDAQMVGTRNLHLLGSADRVTMMSMAGNGFRSVLQTLDKVRPAGVYKLAGQSSVGSSFDQPVETLESHAVATLNLLESWPSRGIGAPRRNTSRRCGCCCSSPSLRIASSPPALHAAWKPPCRSVVLCWPVALLALVLWSVVWLIFLPFRLVGIALEAVFALLRALLFLPARLLGHRA